MNAESDLGEVETGLFAREATFERRLDVLKVSDAQMVRLEGHSCKLEVSLVENPQRWRFEVSGLRRFREPVLKWRAERQGGGGQVVRLRVVRIIPFSWVALSTVPLFYFFRHYIALFGNVATAVASAAPWFFALLAEKFTPLKERNLNRQWGLLLIAVSLTIYFALRVTRPCEAIVSQDDARVIDGKLQPPGVVQLVWRSKSLDNDKAPGCAWTNGTSIGCRSKAPFLAPADRLLDGFDAMFGSPVTRLRCQSDVAELPGLASSPLHGMPCDRIADTPLRTHANPSDCAVVVREAAEGRCGPVHGVRDAWLDFPQFLATARLATASPGLKAHLECREDGGCATMESAGQTQDVVEWDHPAIAAVELSGLCDGESDSVCAVRSRDNELRKDDRLTGVPLPRGTPFHVTAALGGAGGTDRTQGPIAEAECNIREPGALRLRVALLEDAKWIKTASVFDEKGTLILKCAPAGETTVFALIVPSDGAARRLEVAASDAPSSQTILPVDHWLDIRLRGGEREWELEAHRASRYARVARLDCPNAAAVRVCSTDDGYCSRGTASVGKADSLLFVSDSAEMTAEATAEPDPHRCSRAPKPLQTLPFVVHCRKEHAPDAFNRYNGPLEELAWCP